MLQQTRVEAVLPYYERFLARFPTVEALAAARLEEVLALWSGLGYYRRARQLHAAAVRIAAGGAFPGTVAGLRALPGVGDYTAAAVASIAFGVQVPVMDGNVERVMARRLAQAGDPKSAGARRQLLVAAAALLEPARPGDSNQALMELGATLCLPARPRCLLCPLRAGCRAALAGEAELYPPPRRKRAPERRQLLVAVVVRGERVLLYRRPAESELLAGTWELPWMELDEASGSSAPSPTPPKEVLAAKYGGGWRLGRPVAEVRHGITHRDLRVTVCRAELDWAGAAEVSECGASGWFDAAERAALPMSSLVGKVLRAIAVAGPERSSESVGVVDAVEDEGQRAAAAVRVEKRGAPAAAGAGGVVRRRGRRASRSSSRRPE
jgi:A/G-specific adenine glycosylase